MKSKVTTSQEEVTTVTVKEVKTITLELEPFEAWVLYQLTQRVSGSPDKSVRGVFSSNENSMSEVLYKSLIEYYGSYANLAKYEENAVFTGMCINFNCVDVDLERLKNRFND